ncbi:zinc-binding alcohol dehydrogenase [Vagococcus sp. BWB3-3]|uniref:Zinc-binding alcohol dehydrogenase n=1 Tax=Vagococcus allomyrinae TaxID=2794353 RepID=A0A940PBC5_9ENTE|nr:zinc-binding alcohol dehydrogenase [Vagococcus allomyrinae]MBP1039578.1 zinc-binding alcohol dehydrogenase [Vagococcus allomyrinae]
MKYIGARNGKVAIFESEVPQAKPGYVLIKTSYSAISPGTEITMMGNSKGDIVTLGYSAAGIVEEIGENVTNFKKGDRVACYGAPYVQHAEYLAVPKTLVCSVPDHVDLKEACLAGIGAISIHALRKADLQFGETSLVVGLGIFGQLIGQIAENAGHQVIALNRSKPRADVFQATTGIDTFTDETALEAHIKAVTNMQGVDAVFLCTGGDSSYLTNKSLEWCRDKGKSVIVGDLQPNYERTTMFAKEIDILISRAGGPGRYDPSYERDAVDYPYGQVRWTEGRNTAEFIRLLANKRIDVSGYVTNITDLDTIDSTYHDLQQSGISVLTHIIRY